MVMKKYRIKVKKETATLSVQPFCILAGCTLQSWQTPISPANYTGLTDLQK